MKRDKLGDDHEWDTLGKDTETDKAWHVSIEATELL